MFSDDDTLLTSQATLEIASRASCKDDVLDRSAAKHTNSTVFSHGIRAVVLPILAIRETTASWSALAQISVRVLLTGKESVCTRIRLSPKDIRIDQGTRVRTVVLPLLDV